jgi:hypothetical protein
MPFEGSHHDSGIGSNLMDFGAGVVNSAVLEPYRAINQLTGDNLPGKEVTLDCGDTIGGKTGNLVGTAVDLIALSKGVGKGIDRLHLSSGAIQDLSAVSKSRGFLYPGAANAASLSGTLARAGVVGGLYGGVLTPTEQGQNLIVGRLENAAASAATFAAMGGAAYRLSRAEHFSVPSLMNKVKVGAIAGGAGGVVNAEANALMNGKVIASPDKILSGAGDYAVLGGLMAGGGHLLDSARAKESKAGDTVGDASGNIISPTANVHSDASSGRKVYIGDGTVVEAGATSEQSLSDRLLKHDLYDGLPGNSVDDVHSESNDTRISVPTTQDSADKIATDELAEQQRSDRLLGHELYDGLPEHSVDDSHSESHGNTVDSREEALRPLSNSDTEVASHYVVDQGKTYKLDEQEQVWHEGDASTDAPTLSRLHDVYDGLPEDSLGDGHHE